MSLPIYQGHQTPSTVQRIVNEGACGCIVRDLETIIVLPSWHSISSTKVSPLTIPAEVTIQGLQLHQMPGDGRTAIKVEPWA